MIRSLLRHRAEVVRGLHEVVDGISWTSWDAAVESLPCLLSVDGFQTEKLSEDDTADRLGILFTLPGANVKPGDRLNMTRGAVGTFRVLEAPANVATLNGLSHCEFRVSEVVHLPRGVVDGGTPESYSSIFTDGGEP